MVKTTLMLHPFAGDVACFAITQCELSPNLYQGHFKGLVYTGRQRQQSDDASDTAFIENNEVQTILEAPSAQCSSFSCSFCENLTEQ